MARIMICDDDTEMIERLCQALVAAGHTPLACRHTMDVLRRATAGEFDLLALALDAPGFGSSNAALALNHLAPDIPLVGFHHTPSALVGTPQHRLVHNVIERPVPTQEFIEVVAAALATTTATARPVASRPVVSDAHLVTS